MRILLAIGENEMHEFLVITQFEMKTNPKQVSVHGNLLISQ